MGRSLPKVCPFLVTVDLKLKWPELPRPTLVFEIQLLVRQKDIMFHNCVVG